jgi:hypothetical protein
MCIDFARLGKGGWGKGGQGWGGGRRGERDRGIIIGLLSISGLIETCWLVGGGGGWYI